MKYLLLILAVTFYSCLEKKEFKKTIKLDSFGKSNYSYDLLKQEIEKAKLEDIENGYDSIFIRLTFSSPSKSYVTQVVEIKYDNKIWVYTQFELKNLYEGDSITKLISSKQQNVVVKNPKNGWPLFINNIFELGIATLPDSHDIKNLLTSSHSYYVGVTIATKYNFRYYSLPLPQISETKNIKETEKGKEIIYLIVSEFGVSNYIYDHLSRVNQSNDIEEELKIKGSLAPLKEVFKAN